MFIRLVIFETKQWFLTLICFWFQSVISRDCRLRLFEYFYERFPKKGTFFSPSCFLYLFNASTRLFWIFSFAQSHKILSKFSNLSAILKHRGKNFVMMMPIVRLSAYRSQARTNQNARITWVIIYVYIHTLFVPNGLF